MPRPDAEGPRPQAEEVVETPKSTLDTDAAYIRENFQESYPKDHPNHDNEAGRHLTVETLELTDSLLKKYKDEVNNSNIIQKARQELESGVARRIANEVSGSDNEDLFTLIDLIIEQTPGDLIFTLAANSDTQDATRYTDNLSSAYKTREVRPVSDEQLPSLIRTCARQKMLSVIGSEYYDRLAAFEKQRANAPQAFIELIQSTPKATPPKV